jgi:hypothetical protein
MTSRKNVRGTRAGHRPFTSPAVAAVFAGYPPKVRRRLMALRKTIFDTARETEGVGELNETLKWGQPAYLTLASGSGSSSTIRIDALKGEEGGYALYVHCQTSLVDTFRSIYGDVLTFGGNRSILFDAKNTIPEAPLQHCIRLALTYKLTMTGSRRKSSG